MLASDGMLRKVEDGKVVSLYEMDTKFWNFREGTFDGRKWRYKYGYKVVGKRYPMGSPDYEWMSLPDHWERVAKSVRALADLYEEYIKTYKVLKTLERERKKCH